MKFLKTLVGAIDGINRMAGHVAGWVSFAMVAVVFCDVVMRYAFNTTFVFVQELEWHLYASVFLFGISYALRHNGHVRVDLIYERYPIKYKAWTDLIGTLIFLFPFTAMLSQVERVQPMDRRLTCWVCIKQRQTSKLQNGKTP